MSRMCLYYLTEQDRWLPGDRFIRPIIRRIVRGKSRLSGVDKVFMNLCLGLDKLRISYEVNLPYRRLRSEDRVGILGLGRHCLAGYDRPNPIVAGIGLMTHPSEWPSLCQDYPVVKYLQHSKWANNVYVPYYGERCGIWPVGIDTEAWKPEATEQKTTDFLIYYKVRWNREQYETSMLQPIRSELNWRGLSFAEIQYGFYTEEEFHLHLKKCRAMIFLCEHESQGLAYQECLASGVPILAWDQGWCLDPTRFDWGQTEIPASSVPYFDERCGNRFADISQFSDRLTEFWEELQAGTLRPRDYMMENLTLEKCAQDFLCIVEQCSK